MKLFNGILPCLLLPALPAWWEHQEKEEDDNEDDEDGEDEEEDDEDDDDKREKKEDEEKDDALLTYSTQGWGKILLQRWRNIFASWEGLSSKFCLQKH